mmetsp:Transcript_111062/g.324873  ORF Transcript_111062/g.324873 Transcript_111062/m.324873 type:complete len:355 (+) Transcript_111062:315-1379(+)
MGSRPPALPTTWMASGVDLGSPKVGATELCHSLLPHSRRACSKDSIHHQPRPCIPVELQEIIAWLILRLQRILPRGIRILQPPAFLFRLAADYSLQRPLQAWEARQRGNSLARNALRHCSSRQQPGTRMTTSMPKGNCSVMERCAEAQQWGAATTSASSSLPRPGLGSGPTPTLREVREMLQLFAGSPPTVLRSSRRPMGSGPTPRPQERRLRSPRRRPKTPGASSSARREGRCGRAGATAATSLHGRCQSARQSSRGSPQEHQSCLRSPQRRPKTPGTSSADRRGRRRGRVRAPATAIAILHRLCQSLLHSLRGFLKAACPSSRRGLCRTPGSQKWGASQFGTRSWKSLPTTG